MRIYSQRAGKQQSEREDMLRKPEQKTHLISTENAMRLTLISLKPLGLTILAAKTNFIMISHWKNVTGSCRKMWDFIKMMQTDFCKLLK